MNTNAKENTGVAGVASANNSKTITRTAYGWTALDSAVVVQLGHAAPIVDGERVTLEEEAAQEIENVGRCSCGAAGGFGGFIYYGETWEFFRANRAAIRATLQEMAESVGDGGAVELVRNFATFKDDKPSADDVGAILWGELPEKWEEHRNAAGKWVRGGDCDPFGVANACAWFALEETAHKWNDGAAVEDDEEEEEEGGAQ